MRENNWCTNCGRCGHSQIGRSALATETPEVSQKSLEWKCSIATKECFDWIADGMEIPKEVFKISTAKAIESVGSANAVAKLLGHNHHCILRWLDGSHKPRFASIIRLSVTFDIPVQEMFRVSMRWPTQKGLLVILPEKLYPMRLRNCKVDLKMALEHALAKDTTDSLSFSQVCSKFGVGKTSARKCFPELAERLIAKRVAEIQVRKKELALERASRLDQLTKDLEQECRKATRHQIRMLMLRRGEKNAFQILRLHSLRQAQDEKPRNIEVGASTAKPPQLLNMPIN